MRDTHQDAQVRDQRSHIISQANDGRLVIWPTFLETPTSLKRQ
jgi:hypothetical protein